MFNLLKFILIFILLVPLSGCVYDVSVGPSKGLEFDRANNLKKFEGTYEDSPTGGRRNRRQLSSLIWPTGEFIGAETLEVQFEEPNFLIVRAYFKGDLVKQGTFEEDKDFTFRRGVILAGQGGWKSVGGGGAMDPMFGATKGTYQFGLDEEGHIKVRFILTEIYSDLYWAFIPVGGKTFDDVRYKKITSILTSE